SESSSKASGPEKTTSRSDRTSRQETRSTARVRNRSLSFPIPRTTKSSLALPLRTTSSSTSTTIVPSLSVPTTKQAQVDFLQPIHYINASCHFGLVGNN